METTSYSLHTPRDAAGVKKAAENLAAPPAVAPAQQAIEDAIDDLIDFIREDSIAAISTLPNGRGMVGPNRRREEELRAALVARIAELHTPPAAAQPGGDPGFLRTHAPVGTRAWR